MRVYDENAAPTNVVASEAPAPARKIRRRRKSGVGSLKFAGDADPADREASLTEELEAAHDEIRQLQFNLANAEEDNLTLLRLNSELEAQLADAGKLAAEQLERILALEAAERSATRAELARQGRAAALHDSLIDLDAVGSAAEQDTTAQDAAAQDAAAPPPPPAEAPPPPPPAAAAEAPEAPLATYGGGSYASVVTRLSSTSSARFSSSSYVSAASPSHRLSTSSIASRLSTSSAGGGAPLAPAHALLALPECVHEAVESSPSLAGASDPHEAPRPTPPHPAPPHPTPLGKLLPGRTAHAHRLLRTHARRLRTRFGLCALLPAGTAAL